MERWVVEKFGLFNFWFYDDVEFKLSNGKIIFRGTNGSGKSVTTQSFIPLLLDGDKRPSRIDPFGSNARKIENYVLVDEKIEDRISYLYMEFKKPQSESFITIGMGLRGRKGKKLDSWYFILKDGRRINKDFKLYKFSGEKYPLTSKQLQNELGEGNVFTTSQKEYMEKVNEHLFGYYDIDNYKDLLNLLIQLRSPKLSKDFKPTVIYEILKNSLNTLSQDDLRSMAEAMDNMDSLNTKLNELNKSIESLDKIEKSFKKYNLSIMYNKCKKYTLKAEEVSAIRKTIDEENKKLRLLTSSVNAKKIDLNNLRKELEISKAQESALKGNKGFVLRDEITKEENLLDEIEKNLKDKQDSYTSKYNLRLKREDDIKKEQYEVYSKSREFKDVLNDEEYYRNQCFFYYDEDLSKILDLKEEYDFKSIISSIYEYERLVTYGLDILKKAENILKQLNLEEEKQHKLQGIVEIKENALRESKEYLTNIKSEYIEKINVYIDSLSSLKINNSDKIEIFKYVNEINEERDINKIFDKLKETAHDIKLKIMENKLSFMNKKDLIDEKINEVLNKIVELNKNKEVIYEDENIFKAKTLLKEAAIPYEDFYKLVDFKETVKEEEKDIIEAHLYNMGILNSIVVPFEYKDKAFQVLKNNTCKIMFSDLKEEEENITQFLTAIGTDFNKKYEGETLKILKSIGINYSSINKTFVSIDNGYSIGIIKGESDKNYKAHYIGIEARENFRKRKIEALNEEKNEALKEKEDILAKIKVLDEEENVLLSELNNFPQAKDISAAIRIIEENSNALDKENRELLFVNEKVEEFNKENRAVKSELFEACEHIKIPKTRECYEDALKDIHEYIRTINKLKDIYLSIMYCKKNIISLNEYLQEVLDDLDNINDEIYNIKDKINKKKNSIDGLKEAIKSFNLGELEEEYKKVTGVINDYPGKIEKLSNKVTKEESDIEYCKNGIEKDSRKLLAQNELLALLRDAVLREIDLKYIDDIENLDLNDAIKWALDNEDINSENVLSELFSVFNSNEGYIADYHPKIQMIFNNYEEDEDIEKNEILKSAVRYDIKIKLNKRDMSIYDLIKYLKIKLEEESILINEKEKEVFENTLIDTLSTKINAKIYKASGWVKEIDSLMKSMNTTSGFKLYLNWKPKRAESEGEMDVKQLTHILSTSDFMTPEEREKVSDHFKEKLKREKRIANEDGSRRSYQSIIKEVLDYRQWFEFQLSFSKPNMNKKELTDNEFFKLSGGEKAMAMYIPLFAAVNARYNAADKKDCPRIISLDEAFAGVDEENISSMFALIESLNLDYVLNSQSLWGTYESVKELSIYELIREGEDVVLPIKYHWNGHIKTMEEMDE